MANRTLIILVFGIAIVLTVVGVQQVWLYKWVPPQRIAVWFPWLLFIRLPGEFSRFLLCMVQFPFFATAFSIGIRRWKVVPTLCVVLFSYALCVIVGLAILKSK